MNFKNPFALTLCGLLLFIQAACCQTVDSFDPNGSGFFGGGSISTFAVQPDGKVLFAGGFNLVDGLNRNNIARVNSDGSLDPNFNPGAYGTIGALLVQQDGRIVVGGSFTALGGLNYTNLARLNADGSVDTSFNPKASGSVLAIAAQSDGRILVGGGFTNLSGQSCMRIGRLNNDGSLDTNFNASANNNILLITIQTNGCILVGGTFTNLNGTAIKRIARLNADGSLDATFNPDPSSSINNIMVQPDNRILVSGTFTNIAGTNRLRIARLNSDGAIDAGFNPGADGSPISTALQANGKILLGGTFTTLAGGACSYIGRLNSNGTLDSTFNPGANNVVKILALQKDGRVLVGGLFTNLAGVQRNYLGRLINTDVATEAITNSTSSVTWLRGGASAEVGRAAIEMATNGVDWVYLGDGARVSGGWQLNTVFIPDGACLRANGYFTGNGILSGFSSFFQDYGGAPYVITQPADQKIVLGSNSTLTAVVGGSATLYYQWRKNGTNLVTGGKVFGANGPSLLITNFVGTNAGYYSLVVSNSYGSVTSSVASLSVVSAITNDTFAPNWSQLTVYSTICQTDGKVVVGRNIGMTRINGDGSSDPSFTSPNASPYSVNLEVGGRLVAGGAFATLSGQPHAGLGRLNSNGRLDASFAASANGTVYSVLQQPDGKIIAVGTFTQIAGQAASGIARLRPDGTVDDGFTGAASNIVYCVALQTNGQIIIGGTFTNLGGSTHRGLARLNPDGSLDQSFNPSIDHYWVAGDPVYCLAVQRDGKILVGGGFFLAYGDLIKPWLMRLNADGTLDTTFNATPNSTVYSLALQADGKILIGGSFTLVNGVAHNYFARLNSNGTVDATYVASASSTVFSTAIQRDGKVLLGGNFTALYDSKSSVSRPGLGRLSNTEVATHSLAFDGTSITWLRGGTSPEPAWVVFDSSNDGFNWSVLGRGVPTANGWQLTGISTLVTNCIRALGYIPCGQYNGSGWYVMDALTFASNNPPTILFSDNHSGIATPMTNGLGFDLAALIGQTVIIENSTNLQNWSPIFTNAITTSPFYFLDPTRLPSGGEFYRARLF